MANVKVSYQEIDNAATKLVAGRDEIVSKLKVLQSQIQELVSSGFVTDKASGAYQANYDKFTQGASQTVEGLDGLAKFLRGTSSAMQELDSQLAARLNG